MNHVRKTSFLRDSSEKSHPIIFPTDLITRFMTIYFLKWKYAAWASVICDLVYANKNTMTAGNLELRSMHSWKSFERTPLSVKGTNWNKHVQFIHCNLILFPYIGSLSKNRGRNAINQGVVWN